MKTCNARTRSGTPCKQKAGWATAHVGEGRCKLHGGNAGRPIIHGRYSTQHRQSLQSKMDHFLSDPEPANLLSELALLRALLQSVLGRLTEGHPMDSKTRGVIFDMVESIGKMVERIARIINQTALTAAEVQFLQRRYLDLMIEFVPNERLNDFWAKFEASFGILGTDARASLADSGGDVSVES